MASKTLTLSEALMRLAYDLVYNRHDVPLEIWWSTHYHKPIFHQNLDDYYSEELTLEWYINRFMQDKNFRRACEYQIADVAQLDEEWLKKEMGNLYKGPLPKRTQEMSKEITETGGEFHDTFPIIDPHK